MISSVTKFTNNELWQIPTNEKERIEMTRKSILLSIKSNSRANSDNMLIIIKTALRAIDFKYSDFKSLLPREIGKISCNMPATDVFYIFDLLSIPLNAIDMGYNPYIHRLNILSNIEKNEVHFKISIKLQKYLFRLKRFREKENLNFYLRHYGGELLKRTLVEKGLINQIEFEELNRLKLESVVSSRFDSINNYLYSKIDFENKDNFLSPEIFFNKVEHLNLGNNC